MEIYKPIKRVFVPRTRQGATIALPAASGDLPPTGVDAEIVEFQGDDGWQQWQDSVMVEEFTNDALQTVPGALE